VDSNRITTVKNRVICNSQHIARIDEESTGFIDPGLEETIFNAIEQTIVNRTIDVIIFVDYDKGMITPTLFEKVQALACQHDILIAADPKKRNFGIYRKVDLLKPNFKEFVDGTGQIILKGDLEALKKVAEQYKKEKSLKTIFITLSELGVFISNTVSQNYYPAEIRYIADVSGAGDTVLAVASLCLAAGTPLHIMAILSNIAGGLVCEQVGVVPVDRERFIRELEKTNFSE
jgi:rfaE bifunctional protein kinase chain/domain